MSRFLTFPEPQTPSAVSVLELHVAELGDVIQRLFDLHAVRPDAVYRVGAVVDRLIAAAEDEGDPEGGGR